MKKFSLIGIIVLSVLLGILAIGDLDYNISVALVNTDSIWAQFFNLFGEIPFSVAMLVGTALLFGSRNKEIKSKNIMGWVFGLVFIVLFSFLIVFAPINYAFEHSESGIPPLWIIIAVLLAMTITILTVVISNKHPKECLQFRKTGLFFIVLVISEILLVNVLKIVWGRPRMRSIEDVSEFKHWFEISGLTNDNEYKSFPSGHTANAFVMIAFTMLTPLFKRIKAKYIVITTIVWGILVAISRVVLGAHFLSDVLVGCFVTLFLFLGLYRLFFKKPFIVDKIS